MLWLIMYIKPTVEDALLFGTILKIWLKAERSASDKLITAHMIEHAQREQWLIISSPLAH